MTLHIYFALKYLKMLLNTFALMSMITIVINQSNILESSQALLI